MIEALKQTVVPHLRERGFKGSFPHFRKIKDHTIDLITFQFNRYGGSFVVELACAEKDSVYDVFGQLIPANKVTAHDLHERVRLKDNNLSWFDYEQFEVFEQYEELANKITALLLVETFLNPLHNSKVT